MYCFIYLYIILFGYLYFIYLFIYCLFNSNLMIMILKALLECVEGKAIVAQCFLSTVNKNSDTKKLSPDKKTA